MIRCIWLPTLPVIWMIKLYGSPSSEVSMLRYRLNATGRIPFKRWSFERDIVFAAKKHTGNDICLGSFYCSWVLLIHYYNSFLAMHFLNKKVQFRKFVRKLKHFVVEKTLCRRTSQLIRDHLFPEAGWHCGHSEGPRKNLPWSLFWEYHCRSLTDDDKQAAHLMQPREQSSSFTWRLYLTASKPLSS